MENIVWITRDEIGNFTLLSEKPQKSPDITEGVAVTEKSSGGPFALPYRMLDRPKIEIQLLNVDEWEWTDFDIEPDMWDYLNSQFDPAEVNGD